VLRCRSGPPRAKNLKNAHVLCPPRPVPVNWSGFCLRPCRVLPELQESACS
jgi:hypothetical protein